MGRPPTYTKIGPKKVVEVRCRGGNIKRRALMLESGSFSWPTVGKAACAKIREVVYNANTGLQRTNVLIKNAVVSLDAEPFSQLLQTADRAKIATEFKPGLLEGVERQLAEGKVLAVITTRPGQMGAASGRLLEGEELAFYQQHIKVKKTRGTKAQAKVTN